MPGLMAHCPRDTTGPVQGMALLSRALRARRLRTSSHGEERSGPGPRHPARAAPPPHPGHIWWCGAQRQAWW